MKAPWFPFYTGDFLASATVQDMEAHEVGAYTLLLARSWQSDTPGYLEDDEYAMRRAGRLTAEQWAQAKTPLLRKWPLAEDKPGYRYNPRLLAEAQKQVELRELKAEAGRKSAERRAAVATQRQQSGNTNPTPVENTATGVGENGNYSQPQSQPQSQEGKPSSSSFQSEEAASAAAPTVGVEIEAKELSPESPQPELRTPGGAADVGTRKGRGKKDKPQPGSADAADYQMPDWATTSFVEEFAAWLARRQTRTDCKPLTAPAVQARLNELGRYDEAFCSTLFRQAEQNPHWQGLTFDNTPHKFTQHVLQLQKLQHDANRINQPERGAKPTEAASYGARALSAQLRAIREERSAQNGSYVHPGAAAGTHAGLGSPVPPGVGAPQGG